MYRKPAKQKTYRYHNKTQNSCPFCDYEDALLIKKYKYFLIIRNKFSYDLWDLREVEDHLMVVPKSHHLDFSDFSSNENREFMQIIKEYSERGFDSFTRSMHSTLRSQMHIHTHLIKTSGKEIKEISYNVETDILEYKA